MGKPNNWREKREEQHQVHNRKPGHAAYYKESRNRLTRRYSNKINRKRVDGKIPTFTDEKPPKIKPLGPSKTRPKPPTKFYLEEFLTEEQREELNDLE